MSPLDPDDDDPLFARLRALAPPPPPGELADLRLRRRAHAVLAEERRLARVPLLRPVVHAWSRVIAPALVAGSVGVYLVWAIDFAGSLYR